MRQVSKVPNHVAIILDGNGRWAKKRGLPRSVGHYYGGMNIQKIVRAADKLGIKMLTLYCFSTENWQRPIDEVKFLMSKPIEIINNNYDKIINSNIKITTIGRLDRIPKDLLAVVQKLTFDTKNKTGTQLVIALDYGAYDEIIDAAKKCEELTIENLTNNLAQPTPVDLLIRPGGELRLSNYLLWQSAMQNYISVKNTGQVLKKKTLLKRLKYIKNVIAVLGVLNNEEKNYYGHYYGHHFNPLDCNA
jgi:undecaprenyl diphosphate synthase